MFHLDAIEAIKTLKYDHIITDPPYDNLPDINILKQCCPGNIVLFCNPLKRPHLIPDEILFWIKTPSTKNTSRKCSRFVEEIMIYHGKKQIYNHLHWSNMTGVFTDTIIEKNQHPWQKPASLMEKLIRIYSNPGDTVLDPYAGSGTTLKAAEGCERKAIGCDIDEKWTKGNK